MNGFPTWAREYIGELKMLLQLQSWTIHPKISSHPANDSDNNGACFANSNTLEATITINEAIVDCPAYDIDGWKLTLIHEMLHVSHSAIDSLIRLTISPKLGDVAEKMADEVYIQTMEPYIANMTYVIWSLLDQIDTIGGAKKP